MKSSVFQPDSSRIAPSKRRSLTGSPYMTNSSNRQKTMSSKKAITWNLDELIHSYQENHELPPLLSPTIPDNLQGKVDEYEMKQSPIIKGLKSEGSPIIKGRIPEESSIFKGLKTEDSPHIKGLKSEDSPHIKGLKPEDSPIIKGLKPESVRLQSPTLKVLKSDSVPLQSPRPSYPIKRRVIHDYDDEDRDNDGDNLDDTKDSKMNSPFIRGSLPLLSPTLPTIFDKKEKLNLAKVRWINKLQDQKPKFLIRIKFDNVARYKHKQKSAKKKVTSPTKLAGLGIITNGVGKDLKNKLDKKDDKDLVVKKEKTRHKDETKDIGRENDQENDLEQELLKQQKILMTKVREFEDKQRKLNDRENALALLEKELDERELRLRQSSLSNLTTEQQKKHEKLKQLNKDVIMEELVTNIGKKTSPNASKSSPQLHNLTKKQKDEIKDSLIHKKNFWSALVKDCRIVCDTEKDQFLAIIMNVDIILMLMIANDYDERSKVVIDVLPSERSWKSLDQDVKQLITKIDNFTINLNEKNLLEFLKILKCVLFQLRAIITNRIDSILTKVIVLYSSKLNNSEKSDYELQSRIIDLQKTCIKNHELINRYFISSKPNYLIAIIPIKFPLPGLKKQ